MAIGEFRLTFLNKIAIPFHASQNSSVLPTNSLNQDLDFTQDIQPPIFSIKFISTVVNSQAMQAFYCSHRYRFGDQTKYAINHFLSNTLRDDFFLAQIK